VNKRLRLWLVGLGLLALIGAGLLAGAWLVRELSQPPLDYQAGNGVGEVTIVVEPGQDLTEVGRNLVAQGVVLTVEGFIKASLRNPDSTQVTPGTYALPTQITSDLAIELLLDPETKRTDQVVIPEGLRLTRIIDLLAEQTGVDRGQFEAAIAKAPSLGLPDWANENPEGFLFPATYTFDEGESAESMVKTMIERFNQAIADTNLLAGAKARGYTPYEMVIIASLLEGEGQPEHFGRVARVIENRFEQKMPLQFDSTVNYGLGTSEISLTQSQLDTQTPYNSYLNPGLPPTPIGSPGEAALRAALDPPPGDWLYFVTVNPDTGETRFSKSYQEFLANKAIFTQWLKQNK
jgi:UPF0755 protein